MAEKNPNTTMPSSRATGSPLAGERAQTPGPSPRSGSGSAANGGGAGALVARTQEAAGRARAAAGRAARKAGDAVAGKGKVIAATAGVVAATAAGVAAIKALRSRSSKGGAENGRVYHVQSRGEDWQVTIDGNERPAGTYGTKKQAITAGRTMAQKHEPSRLIIHGGDGAIQRTHSYGDE